MARRLTGAALAGLPAAVARPRYDRAALRTGIVHLGLGAFHRAHQAAYTEAVLAAGDARWGTVAASLRSPDLPGKCPGPFRPGEQALPVQRDRQRERVRFPGLAEHRAAVIPGQLRQSCQQRSRHVAHATFARATFAHSAFTHAGSRYGSQASIDTWPPPRTSPPHSSAASNTTV